MSPLASQSPWTSLIIKVFVDVISVISMPAETCKGEGPKPFEDMSPCRAYHGTAEMTSKSELQYREVKSGTTKKLVRTTTKLQSLRRHSAGQLAPPFCHRFLPSERKNSTMPSIFGSDLTAGPETTKVNASRLRIQVTHVWAFALSMESYMITILEFRETAVRAVVCCSSPSPCLPGRKENGT